MLPNLKLKSAYLSLYLYLGNIADDIGYDVIDSNVNLPSFVVKSGSAELGVFAPDYQFVSSAIAD